MNRSVVKITDASCNCAQELLRNPKRHKTPALSQRLRLKTLYNTGAVTMLIGVDAHSLQHRQPHVA